SPPPDHLPSAHLAAGPHRHGYRSSLRTNPHRATLPPHNPIRRIPGLPSLPLSSLSLRPPDPLAAQPLHVDPPQSAHRHLRFHCRSPRDPASLHGRPGHLRPLPPI